MLIYVTWLLFYTISCPLNILKAKKKKKDSSKTNLLGPAIASYMLASENSWKDLPLLYTGYKSKAEEKQRERELDF